VPSGSSSAAWPPRGAVNAGAELHELVAGLNTSTLAIEIGASSVPCAPPATTTRPSAKRVAECSVRTFGML
jgi:hypothetical protein